MNVRRYSYANELILKQKAIQSFGLSLSDQYGFHEIGNEASWEAINFFQNDFEYKKFLLLSFSERENEYAKIDMIFSPNSTTGGH